MRHRQVRPHNLNLLHIIIACRILTGIYLLVIKELDEPIKARSHDSPKNWPDPIDPVVRRELRGCDCRSQRARWIQGATGVKDACFKSVSESREEVWGLEMRYVPPIMATKSANPIPIGAMNVSLLFSAASMSTTKTSSAVMNISMNTPWTTLVEGDSEVFVAAMSPGNITFTTAPAHIAAMSCAGNRNRVRIGGTTPDSTRPRVTYDTSITSSEGRGW